MRLYEGLSDALRSERTQGSARSASRSARFSFGVDHWFTTTKTSFQIKLRSDEHLTVNKRLRMFINVPLTVFRIKIWIWNFVHFKVNKWHNSTHSDYALFIHWFSCTIFVCHIVGKEGIQVSENEFLRNETTWQLACLDCAVSQKMIGEKDGVVFQSVIDRRPIMPTTPKQLQNTSPKPPDLSITSKPMVFYPVSLNQLYYTIAAPYFTTAYEYKSLTS